MEMARIVATRYKEKFEELVLTPIKSFGHLTPFLADQGQICVPSGYGLLSSASLCFWRTRETRAVRLRSAGNVGGTTARVFSGGPALSIQAPTFLPFQPD